MLEPTKGAGDGRAGRTGRTGDRWRHRHRRGDRSRVPRGREPPSRVTGRRPGPLAEVVDRIEADGGAALACPADVTDIDAMQVAVAAVVERFGHLDLVVANAGAAPPIRPTIETTLQSWREIVDLNLTGVWITAKLAVPALVAHGGGSIIVVGSGAGRANEGGLGSYSAAKAGASALTRRARGGAARGTRRGERARARPGAHPGDRGAHPATLPVTSRSAGRGSRGCVPVASGSRSPRRWRVLPSTWRRCRSTAPPGRCSACSAA